MTSLDLVHAEADGFAQDLDAAADRADELAQGVKAAAARMSELESELDGMLAAAATTLNAFVLEQMESAKTAGAGLGAAAATVAEAKDDLTDAMAEIQPNLSALAEAVDAATDAAKELAAEAGKANEDLATKGKAFRTNIADLKGKAGELQEEAKGTLDGVTKGVAGVETAWVTFVAALVAELKSILDEVERVAVEQTLLTLDHAVQAFADSLDQGLQQYVKTPISDWSREGRERIETHMNALVADALASLNVVFADIQRALDDSERKAGAEERAMNEVLNRLRPVIDQASSTLDSIKGPLSTVGFNL